MATTPEAALAAMSDNVAAVARSWILSNPPSGLEVLRPLDRQKKSLLMSKPEEANILEVLDGDLAEVVDREIPLALKLSLVLRQPDQVQPLVQRGRDEVRQSVWNCQLRDLRLELLSVVGFLNADRCEILRSHLANGGHVVAGVDEQVVVVFKVQVGQPC